jgi:hypothetical protein
MGYHTNFDGEFEIEPPLTPEQADYLMRFNQTLRMKRDAAKAEMIPDPERVAVGLPIGNDGEYFVEGTGDFGQDEDASVIERNSPPGSQPGLWCQWVPSEDGTTLAWDEGEKFYNYVKWLEYLIKHFLAPWGRKITGQVSWKGEEDSDMGIIYAKDNRVEALAAEITYPDPSWVTEE